MKKKITFTLLMSFALILGSFASAFAAAPPTDVTRKAIEDAGVQTVQKVHNEVEAEAYATKLYNDVTAGKYKLISTADLQKDLGKVLIIDVMPEDWWNLRHIPGSICQVVGANNGPDFKILDSEKTALMNKVTAAVGTKKVTYYWNSKSKKWVTKKPAKKYWKKCTKKKDAHKGKKKYTANVVNKDAKIVVYCGFTGCARSHQAAMYLTSQGFKNVYRYAGGIAAWVDADYDIEGADVDEVSVEGFSVEDVEADAVVEEPVVEE
jgi:rhodanese-related sulfurtransferase